MSNHLINRACQTWPTPTQVRQYIVGNGMMEDECKTRGGAYAKPDPVSVQTDINEHADGRATLLNAVDST